MDNTTDTKIWLNKEAERRLREVSDKIMVNLPVMGMWWFE